MVKFKHFSTAISLLIFKHCIFVTYGKDCDRIELVEGLNELELCPEGSFCFVGKELDGGSNIFPIGRSYNRKPWELYSGRSNSNIEFVCDSEASASTDSGVTPKRIDSSTFFVESACNVELPDLDSLKNEGPYILSECTMQDVTRENELARFLDQVSFGATLEELDSFDDSDPTDVAMAKYVKKQIEDVEMTSHREYFRKHAFSHLNRVYQTVRPMEPCDVNTKWRRYAFEAQDDDKYLQLQEMGGKIILSVGGYIRTMVDSIDWDSQSYINSKGHLKTDGSVEYQICNNPANRIGSEMKVRNPDGRSCQKIRVNDEFGTPAVYIYPDIIEPAIKFDLSPDFVQPTSTQFYSTTEELIVFKKLEDPKCSDEGIRFTDETVFGYYNDTYFIHNPPFALVDNDMYSPAVDGGGLSTKLTDGETMCSNAPMTQFNEEFCVISYDENACRPEPNVLEFEFNHDNMRTIYEATVNDETKETRYPLAIDGLYIDDDSSSPYPCRMGYESRWAITTNSSECDPDISTVTLHSRKYLASLIAQSTDYNPYVRNIYTLNEGCAYDDRYKRHIAVEVNGTCWKHVHQDHMNVYDMTYWYKNKGLEKVKEEAEAGKTIFDFSLAGISTYNWYKYIQSKMDRLGRYGDTITYTDLRGGTLEIDSVKEALKKKLYHTKPGVVVCGTPGETKNDPSIGGTLYRGAFDFAIYGTKTWDMRLKNTRKTIQNMAAVYFKDQFRQKMAWALTSIITIAASSTGRYTETEKRVAFTDIFVRNAFGSYRDILEEVSFSAIMAENLSYRDSKSTEYHWDDDGEIIYPDQNFAREIMQLYSIGLCNLNQDGSEIILSGRVCEQTYTNDEIIEYARVWTGFTRQPKRGNLERTTSWENNNEVDALNIRADWRDRHPKLGLKQEYIGDGYPLCVDRPKHHFLKQNAKYRLLGSTAIPHLQHDPAQWDMHNNAVRMTLLQSSALYEILCNANNVDASCNFKTIVELDSNLECHMNECDVDTVRVVEVEGIYYEYISSPCVEQAFFQNAKKVVKKDTKSISCADPRLEIASTACCACESNAVRKEIYWGEKMSYETAQDRCTTMDYKLCDFPRVKDCYASSRSRPECDHNPYYWSSSPCTIKIKVDPDDGKVAISYETDDNAEFMAKNVKPDNPLFFPVLWKNNEFPTPETHCGYVEMCEIIDGKCVCTVSVTDELVFDATPSRDQALESLHIGSYDPNSLGMFSPNGSTRKLDTHFQRRLAEVTTFYIDETEEITSETVFQVTDDFGVERFLKNTASTVKIGSSFSFRNPPHFISLVTGEKRDAYYETDAALDQLFYNENTAPFLATNIIKHFGISNPTSDYILKVSTAFKTGKCEVVGSTGETFEYGSGKYGDLAALAACIVLSSEARDVILDLDPTHGSVVAPLMNLFKLMRSMEADAGDSNRFIEFYARDQHTKLGQEAYEITSVFSYFMPDFKPSGRIEQGSLVSPESQLLSAPYVIGLLNGMFQLIKAGMKRCYDGFYMDYYSCGSSPGNYDHSGYLGYSPSSSNSDAVIEELSTLLTGGRLSAENKDIIKNMYEAEEDKSDALLMAQQLIVTSPEFHTSGSIVHRSGLPRPVTPLPDPSTEPYKAVIFILLSGGFDSNNLLVPRCEELERQYRFKRGLLALNDNELTNNIAASNQPCEEFAIHHKLPLVEELYNSGDLLFFANTGASDQQWEKSTYRQSKLKLFGHNTMQESVQKLDHASLASGTGVLGRMADALSESSGASGNPYQVGTTAIRGFSYSLVGSPTKGTAQTIVGNSGVKGFNPRKWGNVDLQSLMFDLNNATTLDSTMYGETWSSNFLDAVNNNEFLNDVLENVQTTANFESGTLSDNLKIISRLIKAKDDRRVDRDIFYLSYGGWDHHSDMKDRLSDKFETVNEALESFWNEMNEQGKKDNVCLIITSDFSRTMTPNSQEGSDHGWGGHYFMMGGDVKGNQIVGEFPDDLDGIYTTKGRGSLIPTTPWDSVWYGISQWMGVDDATKLHSIVPGRDTEILNGEFFTKTDLFKNEGLTDVTRRSLRRKN